MAHKVKNNHYVATHRSGVDSPSSGAYLHRGSSREENDSHRAPSERTLSEYTAGVKVDAMAAPNPFCPNVKGMCCLMLLLNLGLILVTLGFVIVLQILGIVFLIFGFITLVGSLIYCVVLCRENPYPRYPDDFYWTHHWSKTIGPSEIHYSASEKPYRQNGHSDRYNKYNGKYSDRESAKGYSDRETHAG
ncbi:hypothetical protein MSG28_004993 [Choristoneura fumiferana]|uniref:Uncharacterized protein n=1 Tax=Choristoneura fumiferana TaxID=7141 RepID=A0ACC0JPM2_CHOFU|nr:hypothetical protein MSG28_004993 [Choristoneura fumiferana]